MIHGALALLNGVRLLLGHAEVREILWRMLAVLLVLMVVLASATFWLIDYITALWIPAGDTWYWQVLSWLAGALAFILAMLCGIVSYVMLGSAVSAPWLDDLAVRTEAIFGEGISLLESGWMQLMLQSLSNSIRPLLGLVPWGVVALLFFWFPPLSTLIWTYGAVRFLAFELIDTTASRRGWSYQERKKMIVGNRWFYLGFSGFAMVLLMVPILNLLVIPAAVVGHSQYLFQRKA